MKLNRRALVLTGIVLSPGCNNSLSAMAPTSGQGDPPRANLTSGNEFVNVANAGSDNVSAFMVNQADGVTRL